MSTGELLSIEPSELKFEFEVKKLMFCSLKLSNKTYDHVAFKVKTTNPKKYCVRPNTGIVSPNSTYDIIVTMQAQKEAPADMNCKDKFLIQSVVATPNEFNPAMDFQFSKGSDHSIEECKLRVVYVSPPRPPSPGELLSIKPSEIKFEFELKKQTSGSLQLSNKTYDHVAFKVKTTNPKKSCVRPNTGIVSPNSTCDIIVTMQAQMEAPADMNCKDKFLIQSVVATLNEFNPAMFNKESGHSVEEYKLNVVYVSPPQASSPVQEGSNEGSSPMGFVSDNGNGSEFSLGARPFHESREKSSWKAENFDRFFDFYRSLEMSTGEVLSIAPSELKFEFELKKEISCSLQLSNNTYDHVAFKVRATNPKKYCVRPNTGIVSPYSTCDIIVTMQAQKEAPSDMNCKDEFFIQSVVATPNENNSPEINPAMFSNESGHSVEECKLRVVYVSTPDLL